MLIFAAYMAVLFLIAFIRGLQKRRRGIEFVTGGRRNGGPALAASLLATVIGASATLGVADLVPQYGAAAIWWLFLGSLGLILMACLTIGPLYRLRAVSVIDALSRLAGGRVALIAASILAFAWIGIIAAQFVALGRVMTGLEGGGDPAPSILLTACVLTAYMAFGGQEALLRADHLQLFVLFFGVGAAFFIVMPAQGGGGFTIEPVFNERFSPGDLVLLAFPLLGAYMLGPDLFGRANSARSLKDARLALLLASLGVFIFAVLIISLALYATGLTESEHPLLGAFLHTLPKEAAWLFCLALVAAMASSVDTCLLTVSSVLCYDIAGTRRVGALRFFMVAAALAAAALALLFREIIPLLLAAYTVYTGAIAAPFLVALLARERRFRVREGGFIAAMLLGGVCALPAVIFVLPFLPLVGIGVGAAVSLLSLRRVDGEET